MICPTEASGVMWSGRCHPFAIHMSIRMTRAVPATIEDRKKETGITGDHHCGASMFGISRYSEPSELWCIVDRVTAAMASRIGSNALLAAVPEHPGQRPEDHGGHGRVDQVAREHEDEQRHRERHVGAGPLLPERQRRWRPAALQGDRQELEERGS